MHSSGARYLIQYLYPYGSVYVFENSIANGVKFGMTGIGVNDVADRLRDVQDMWTERKVTCQICGGRLVNLRGRVRKHVRSGRSCLGGGTLPIERDVALAALHLEKIRNNLNALIGPEKGSAVRMAKTLELRIEKYRHHVRPVEKWQFTVAFYTKGVAEVESLAHKKLEAHLDHRTPFGEVFCCAASTAIEAVKSALTDLGLLQLAQLRTRLPVSLNPSQRTYLRKEV